MHWEKLKPNHFFKEPDYHFYSKTLFDTSEYDRLYENQKNPSHISWQEFDRKYKTGFQLYDDLRDLDLNREVICMWFFKERSDNTAGEDIQLAGKTITYRQNSFFITKSKDIKIVERTKRQHNRRPFVQLDMKDSTFQELLKRFYKIT